MVSDSTAPYAVPPVVVGYKNTQVSRLPGHIRCCCLEMPRKNRHQSHDTTTRENYFDRTKTGGICSVSDHHHPDCFHLAALSFSADFFAGTIVWQSERETSMTMSILRNRDGRIAVSCVSKSLFTSTKKHGCIFQLLLSSFVFASSN